MMAGLSTPTYDPSGALLLQCAESSDIGGVARRVSRTATLDGASVLTDFGVSASDTTIRLSIPVDRALDASLRRIASDYPTLVLTTRLGCYLGTIGAYTLDGKNGIVSFLIQSTLSEMP